MDKIILSFFSITALFFLNSAPAMALPINGHSYPVWLQNLEDEAISQGISSVTVHNALDTVELDDRVIALDQKQPEATISFAAYSKNILTPDTIHEGRVLMRKHKKLLGKIANMYGVPPQIIVALWGIESHYGRNMGNSSVITALTTLAYDGRRADYFRGELFNALRMLDQEHIPAYDLRGSWAGAMGQCQFMPSTYLRYAIDYNLDGRRDIWGTTGDVLASIANYLSAEGWSRELTWGREVNITHPVSPDDLGIKQTKSVTEWSRLGVHGLNNKPLPTRELQASLIQPDGSDGRSFLIYENFHAIMRWNHSTYFAATVGLLAERLR